MDNGKPDLRLLLEKLENGTISAEEEKELIDWFEQLNVGEQPTWKSADHKKELAASIFNVIERRTSLKTLPGLQPGRMTLWRVAAAAILVVAGAAVWLTYSHSGHRQQPEYAARDITVRNDGASPKKIMFPDGSLAWLDAHSSLRYRNGFGRVNRAVWMDGQVLFQVTDEPGVPFVVRSGNLKTTVLGTEFNVDAYSEGSEIKVSLVSGKVRVNDTGNAEFVLRPGQVATQENSGAITVAKVANLESGGWVDGKLVFKETLLSDALLHISKRYNVRFVDDSGLIKQQRVSAVIQDSLNWDAALQNMLFVHQIHLRRTGQTIYLYP